MRNETCLSSAPREVVGVSGERREDAMGMFSFSDMVVSWLALFCPGGMYIPCRSGGARVSFFLSLERYDCDVRELA